MNRKASTLLVAVTLAACSDVPTNSPSSEMQAPASASASADVILGRFIVTLRDGVSPAAVAREHGVAPEFVYTHALNGFAGSISDAAREGLFRDARVSRIEPDGIATTQTTQTSATWGIARIDQRGLPLDALYNYSATGAGVTAYIIDT